ncbi:MAG: transaldolase [Gemmatimonadales bacterium]|nr:transaldolase [Gemmatimonadales bacterium]
MTTQGLPVTTSAARQVRSHGLRVAVFCDGANLNDMVAAYRSGVAQGFTTNPTLMRKAGITDYVGFARDVLREIPDLPISFEVFADDFGTMAEQATKIASWGPNVFVKVPVMNTKREPAYDLIRQLSREGIKLNVTAVMTLDQCLAVREAIAVGTPAILSVFAGRVADTGTDPVPMMREAVNICAEHPEIMVLWASPREVLNIYQADECGCHIITATPDLLAKLPLRGKDLTEYSRETVQMFFDDAQKAGFQL